LGGKAWTGKPRHIDLCGSESDARGHLPVMHVQQCYVKAEFEGRPGPVLAVGEARTGPGLHCLLGLTNRARHAEGGKDVTQDQHEDTPAVAHRLQPVL
jgi:hypothetical protein